MIEAYTLFSGSSGNSLLIRSGSTAVLMDAGRSRRAVSLALAEIGMQIADLRAIFVTHEHVDHTAALLQIHRREGIPIHAAAATAEYLDAAVFGEAVTAAHPPIHTEQVGGLTVTSFPLPHDSRCHVGYLFCDGDGDRFCAATDMGHVTDAVCEALIGCRGALLEANHDPVMLACGRYPAALKARILAPTGHLANGDCARLAQFAAMHGAAHIGLGHLSEENNSPEKAGSAVQTALAGTGVDVVVCDRVRVTRIM